MKKRVIMKTGDCPDCGTKNTQIIATGMYSGICPTCRLRLQNATKRGREYIPYIKLSENDKAIIDGKRQAQRHSKAHIHKIIEKEVEESLEPKTLPITEDYYQKKAENISCVLPKKSTEDINQSHNDYNIQEDLFLLVNKFLFTANNSDRDLYMIKIIRTLNIIKDKIQEEIYE